MFYDVNNNKKACILIVLLLLSQKQTMLFELQLSLDPKFSLNKYALIE